MKHYTDKSIERMPQTVTINGSTIRVTCKAGMIPLHSYEFNESEWPGDARLQEEFLLQIATQKDSGFYSGNGTDVSKRIIESQRLAVNHAID